VKGLITLNVHSIAPSSIFSNIVALSDLAETHHISTFLQSLKLGSLCQYTFAELHNATPPGDFAIGNPHVGLGPTRADPATTSTTSHTVGDELLLCSRSAPSYISLGYSEENLIMHKIPPFSPTPSLPQPDLSPLPPSP